MSRTWLGSMIAIALLGGAPARAIAGGKEHKVDVSGEVDTARGIAYVEDGRVGPVLFRQVIFQNIPNEGELRDADADDRARVLPVLVLSNLGSSRAKLDLKLQLEDDLDRVVMTCTVSRYQGTDRNDLMDKLCGGNESMLTIDWPKVKVVRLVGMVTE
ncbi:MAG TPA: hypothetical protein VEB43_03200 [Anaeromyxobacter sp.]|nr:hypothetical protein [Anaeromyxobacter sp.]